MKPEVETMKDAAIGWAIARAEGLDRERTREFLAWLEADPGHVAALARAEEAIGKLQATRRLGVTRVRAVLGLPERSRRVRLGLTWAGVGLAAGLALFVIPQFRSVPDAMPSSIVQRPDRQVLPDGSTVQLNAGTEIAVDYTSGRRGVLLLRGQALFAVQKDVGRPFVVTAGGVAVRAVGTEFSVKYASRDVEVLVTEGQVAVAGPVVASDAGPPVEPVLVSAGSRLQVLLTGAAPFAVETVAPPEIAAALAWREHRLEFNGTPLGEALALFNRENAVQIELGDPGLNEDRISGIFWADQPANFATLLSLSLPVRVEQRGPDRIVLYRAP